jgi:hypothetical protein
MLERGGSEDGEAISNRCALYTDPFLTLGVTPLTAESGYYLLQRMATCTILAHVHIHLSQGPLPLTRPSSR